MRVLTLAVLGTAYFEDLLAVNIANFVANHDCFHTSGPKMG